MKMTTNYPAKFAHEMADAIGHFIQDATSEMTMDEMYDTKDVSWLELLNRLGEEQVEKMMEKLSASTNEYDAYYDLCDVPPC